jgi:CRP-like cAMP-binding protein
MTESTVDSIRHGITAKVPRKNGAASRINASVQNHLLTALPYADRQRLLANCEQIELYAGDVLYEAGERIRYLYFPADSFISLMRPVDGSASLVELVGSEGMLGVPVVLDVHDSPLRALVQGSGTALRINAGLFRIEFEFSLALRRELHRYVYVLLDQLSQTAACNRFHVLDTRLACWLLMTQDRAHSNTFHLTHEILAQMLGVRRVGITNAAGLLQQKKLVRYSRGDITILDRSGLEAFSCGCYQAMKKTYTHMLG